jgi:hypothetical protein
VALPMSPPMNATARFGWVTLKLRSESPLSKLLHQMARDIVATV